MFLPGNFQLIISLLSSAIICGCWWWVAVKKPEVSNFFGLAIAHSASFALTATSVYAAFRGVRTGGSEAVGLLHSLLAVLYAILYCRLALWLVSRPPN